MARNPGREKRRRRERRGQAVRWWSYLIAGVAAAAVVVVLIVVAALTRGDGGDGGEGGERLVVVPSPRPTEIAREGHVLGSADAPVTVIEYADFQ